MPLILWFRGHKSVLRGLRCPLVEGFGMQHAGNGWDVAVRKMVIAPRQMGMFFNAGGSKRPLAPDAPGVGHPAKRQATQQSPESVDPVWEAGAVDESEGNAPGDSGSGRVEGRGSFPGGVNDSWVCTCSADACNTPEQRSCGVCGLLASWARADTGVKDSCACHQTIRQRRTWCLGELMWLPSRRAAHV